MSGLAWKVLPHPFRPYAALGAGLWWTIPLMQFLFQAGSGSVPGMGGLDSHDDALWFFRLVWFALAVAFALLTPAFAPAKARRSGSLAIIATSLTCLVTQVTLSLSEAKLVPFILAINLLYLTCQTTLMYLWGVRFVLLDAEDAGVTVLYAACVALIATSLASLLPETAMAPTKLVLLAASAWCLLRESDDRGELRACTETPTEQKNVGTPGKHRELVGLYASRAVFAGSMVVGSLFARGIALEEEWLALPWCLALGVVPLVVTALGMSSKLNPASFAPLVPMGALVFMVALFAPTGLAGVVSVAGAAAWFAWIAASSAQLSQLREEGARHLLTHMAVEKSIILVALDASSIAGALTSAADFAPETGMRWLPLATTLVSVLIATYVLIRIYVGQTAGVSDASRAASPDNLYEKACSRLAEQFALSPRERDVMELLGRGYTRSAICERLCIADGTARTHVNHIHDKMGFHRNDELIDMLREQMG